MLLKASLPAAACWTAAAVSLLVQAALLLLCL
jgi:hypothetical protein